MRILVLDDDEAIARMLVRLLRGHQVAASTRPALVIDDLWGGAWFDLILCDLHMPGTDGRSFLAQVKSFYGTDAPTLVLMSGSHQTELGAADALLTKPFTRAELDTLLAMSIELRSQRRLATTQRIPARSAELPRQRSTPH